MLGRSMVMKYVRKLSTPALPVLTGLACHGLLPLLTSSSFPACDEDQRLTLEDEAVP